MVLLGTLVNGACIIAGTLLGKVFHRIPQKTKDTVMYGIGLSVIVLGLQMGFKSQQFLIVILSLVFGAVLGEWIDLDSKLNSLGNWLERKLGANEANPVSQGFVTATLIFVIGAMAIIGALDSGIRNDHDVLYTKAIIDGFTSIILATTLGIGVLFSAVPVMLYQGAIAIFATKIDKWVPQELMDFFITEMTSTGGVMIFAIGLNLIGLTKIRVANLLPGILVTGVLVSIFYYFNIEL
ncbi:DUF554 domain-containing protein [Peribacillus saganii]|uniref:DUF554 domain-containing protein n=1 Tax=Peribacillus saganii TaxID=2303992 RepID=A0A372LKK8_9BACI|nr:DUF554 domain-containing protein [Peribacillus saganii]RFU67263.1 DUF554 domain-containing protein [Peribacillus saganii]